MSRSEETMGRNRVPQPDLPSPVFGPAADTATQAGGPSRRDLLRAAGAGLGAVALAPVFGMGEAADRATTRLTARASGARSTHFGQDWKFVLVNPDGVTDPTGAYANAQAPGLDDSSCRLLDMRCEPLSAGR